MRLLQRDCVYFRHNLVMAALGLANRTLAFVKGRHTKKTAAFVKVICLRVDNKAEVGLIGCMSMSLPHTCMNIIFCTHKACSRKAPVLTHCF